MHTENEQNNKPKYDTTKRMSKPGQQVAVNRTMHGVIELFENESGEYYPVVSWDPAPKLIRGEYHPIANRIQFPKAWGRKWGATKLLEHNIQVQKDILATAKIELERLEKCLESVKQWSDND